MLRRLLLRTIKVETFTADDFAAHLESKANEFTRPLGSNAAKDQQLAATIRTFVGQEIDHATLLGFVLAAMPAETAAKITATLRSQRSSFSVRTVERYPRYLGFFAGRVPLKARQGILNSDKAVLVKVQGRKIRDVGDLLGATNDAAYALFHASHMKLGMTEIFQRLLGENPTLPAVQLALKGEMALIGRVESLMKQGESEYSPGARRKILQFLGAAREWGLNRLKALVLTKNSHNLRRALDPEQVYRELIDAGDEEAASNLADDLASPNRYRLLQHLINMSLAGLVFAQIGVLSVKSYVIYQWLQENDPKFTPDDQELIDLIAAQSSSPREQKERLQALEAAIASDPEVTEVLDFSPVYQALDERIQKEKNAVQGGRRK